MVHTQWHHVENKLGQKIKIWSPRATINKGIHLYNFKIYNFLNLTTEIDDQINISQIEHSLDRQSL